MVVVAIPWFEDWELVEGALATVPSTWRSVPLEGSWALFHDRPADQAQADYPTEAAKRTALARLAWVAYSHAGIRWLLMLDSDERLEVPDPPTLNRWLRGVSDGVRWLNVNIYRPDHPHAPQGFYLPRLIEMAPDLEWRPPRDWEVYRGGERIAPLDGEPGFDGALRVPSTFLRIRHDRALRSVERSDRNARYQQRRRALHGTA